MNRDTGEPMRKRLADYLDAHQHWKDSTLTEAEETLVAFDAYLTDIDRTLTAPEIEQHLDWCKKNTTTPYRDLRTVHYKYLRKLYNWLNEQGDINEPLPTTGVDPALALLPDPVQLWLLDERAKYSDETSDTRESNALAYINWLDTQNIDYLSVDATIARRYIQHLKTSKDYAPSTIRNYYYSLKSLYDELTDFQGITESNPFAPLEIGDYAPLNATKKASEARNSITYFDPEKDHIDLICDHCPSPQPRNSLTIRLKYQTGVRAEELVNIKLADIDREERTIDIHSDKTHQQRTVVYQPSLDIPLNQWINTQRKAYQHHRSSPYLFINSKSPELDPDKVGHMITEAAKNAGINDVLYRDAGGSRRWRYGGHSTRHAFAVQYLRNGGDLRTLQKLLGHESLSQTEVYLDIVDSDAVQAAKKYGPE